MPSSLTTLSLERRKTNPGRLCYLNQTRAAYTRAWHHMNLQDQGLGKAASRIALLLMGKNKPIYDPACESLHTEPERKGEGEAKLKYNPHALSLPFL